MGDSKPATMIGLGVAAQRAYEIFKKEQLALLTVSESQKDSAGPLDWIANNIAGLVPIFGLRENEKIELLSRTEKIKTFPNGTATGIEAQSQSEVWQLQISQEGLATYLRWAREVQ